VQHLRAKETLFLERRFIDENLDPLGFETLHDPLNRALAEIVRPLFHHQPVDAHHTRLPGNDLIGKEIVQTTTIMQDMFADADLPAAQKREVGLAIENMASFLEKAYPGIAITVSGLMVVGLVFMLSLLARGRYTVPGRAFPEWKSPEWLVWILITAGFLVAFVEGIAGTFALNLLVILLPVYFLQGLAVIDCFFRRKAFSPIIRTVGYLLVTLVNPLPMVVTGIGVFDLWADFRKPKEPES